MISYLIPISIVLTAYITARVLKPFVLKDTDTIVRFGEIDGLRGFLGIAVFAHHALYWRNYLEQGKWTDLENNFGEQLGQVPVSLFFMITSFLFINKLLNSNAKPFAWNHFLVARFFRLAPMYYLSVVLIFLVAMQATNWVAVEGIPGFLRSGIEWSSFTLAGNRDVNGFQSTKIINAGVTWTLPFEWLFYFALPLIALLLPVRKPALPVLLVSIAFVVAFFLRKYVEATHLLSFSAGAVAPFILRYGQRPRHINHWSVHVAVLIIITSIMLFGTASNAWCKLLIGLVFTLIALGHNFLGILRSQTLKLLGDACYSTYLLHGILLFVTIWLILGKPSVAAYTDWQYIGLVTLITPLLVLISVAGFLFIEKPFMDRGRRVKVAEFRPLSWKWLQTRLAQVGSKTRIN